MKPNRLMWVVIVCLFAALELWAQQPNTPSEGLGSNPSNALNVPRLIKFSGAMKDFTGKPLMGPVDINFAIYKEQTDAEPLWQEMQTLQLDEQGRYTVLLGAMQPEGLPMELFSSGEARWLEVNAAGTELQPRTLLVSVPYALKASDAETLGGKPASAYLLAPVNQTGSGTTQPTKGSGTAATGNTMIVTAATVVRPDVTYGTANYIPIFTDNAGDTGNSTLYQLGTQVGIATTTPGTLNGHYFPSLLLDAAQATASTYLTADTELQGGYAGVLLNRGAATANNRDWAIENQPDATLTSSQFAISTYNDAGYPTAMLMVTRSGLVGIGTTTPAATLEVNGTGKFDGGVAVAGLTVGNCVQAGAGGFLTTTASPCGSGTASGTITGVTAGTDLTGGGTSGTVTLNLDTTKVPTLGANTFTGIQNINVAAGAAVAGTTSDRSSVGVVGVNTGTGGVGVTGEYQLTTGAGIGVWGYNTSSSGTGVYGENIATTGNVWGVYGLSASSTGIGVEGYSTASTGNAVGVEGVSNSGAGTGVYGTGSFGVNGSSSLSGGAGVVGANSATTGNAFGVEGLSASSTGYGVVGINNATTGVGNGVYGGTAASGGSGVLAINTATTGVAYGVYGKSSSSTGYGVVGLNIATTGVGNGVYGGTAASGGSGVIGINTATTGNAYGVYGGTGYGSGYGGYFHGNVNVTGTLTSGVKDFLIDHPRDAANKYLYHSSVESSEMMNIYTGNVVLDAAGEAVVQLPDWFETLNTDFRYQLTAIGAPGPNLYIAREVQGNSFRIAGGSPGTKVSWQVTGVRQDAYAKAHPLQVEVDKPQKERGYYIHPELYGQPKEKSMEWAHNPELMRQLEGASKPTEALKAPPELPKVEAPPAAPAVQIPKPPQPPKLQAPAKPPHQ